MTPWHAQVNAARTWQELVAAARDHVASLSPQEWNSLPENCRPAGIKGIEDLAFWRARLAEEYLAVAAMPSGHEMLRDMLALFTAAHQRAVQTYATE